MKNLKIILNKVNDLNTKELNIFFSLSSYQIEVLAKLEKRQNCEAKDLLVSKIKLSKAQKYRYIQNLCNKNLIKKSFNCYNLIKL